MTLLPFVLIFGTWALAIVASIVLPAPESELGFYALMTATQCFGCSGSIIALLVFT